MSAVNGQDPTLWDDSAAAVRYVTKGLMSQKRRTTGLDAGYNPGDVLALRVAGHARAAAWWLELEDLFRSPKRFKGRGGNIFQN